MRVALSFPGCHRRGGVERVVLECANFLCARGHDVHLYACEWDEQLLAPGVARHGVARARGPSPMRMLQFARHCRAQMGASRRDADVLGSFGVQSPPGGVLWVTSVHKAWIEISRRERALAGRLRQRLNLFHPTVLALEKYQFAGRRYRRLIALTEQVKLDLMRLYDVPPADIEVIPNGFAPAEFNVQRCVEQRDAIRSRLGFGPQDRVIVFVANEFERKGFGPLIEAIAALGDPRVKLLAAGRLNPARYAPRVAALNLADRVTFMGSTNDVAQCYAAGDLFALPTQYEAWGLVIVEAMACGLPVLTSRLAGAAVAVTEGKGGYLLDDPRNVDEIVARLRLLLDGGHADPDWISTSVQRFGWPRVLLDYERVLQGCARGAAAA